MKSFIVGFGIIVLLLIALSLYVYISQKIRRDMVNIYREQFRESDIVREFSNMVTYHSAREDYEFPRIFAILHTNTCIGIYIRDNEKQDMFFLNFGMYGWSTLPDEVVEAMHQLVNQNLLKSNNSVDYQKYNDINMRQKLQELILSGEYISRSLPVGKIKELSCYKVNVKPV